jgi:membrane-associated protease RseP (regulator of RpoE activity)
MLKRKLMKAAAVLTCSGVMVFCGGPSQSSAVAEDQKLADVVAAPAGESTLHVIEGGPKAGESGFLQQILVIGPDGKAKVVDVQGVRESEQNLNDAEAAKLLQYLEQSVAEPFTPPKYVIGVGVGEVPSVVWSQLKRESQPGVVVAKVVEKTPASQAGVQENDIILKAGDKAIGNQQALVDAIEEAAESAITLTILRGGEELTIGVTPRANEAANVPAEKILGKQWTVQGGVHAFGPGVLIQEGKLIQEENSPQTDLKQELDQLRGQLEQLQKSIDEMKAK